MRWILSISIPASIVIAVLLVPASREWLFAMIALFTDLDIARLQDYIHSLGFWGPAISFALMLLQSVIAPLPAFVLAFANAAVFGWAWGALLTWTSSLTGAVLCFGIARLYGRAAVVRLISAMALDSIDTFFIKYGKHAVLFARLLPFISFDIVSYAAGLTSLRFPHFLFATALGMLPATLVYSYVGGSLTGGTKALVTALMLLFAASVLVVLVKAMLKDKKEKKDKKNK
jgi:uncharacterized membrane protein YdjX (TVP38/TMEM64 family)